MMDFWVPGIGAEMSPAAYLLAQDISKALFPLE